MGGQGGSYVAPYDQWVSVLAANPLKKQRFESQRKNYANEGDWYAAYGGGDTSPLMTPEMSNDIFTKIYGAYTPPPAPPAPAPAPAPAAPAPAAFVPDPGPALATSPTGPMLGTGGGIAGPTASGNQSLGDSLGDSVLRPPQYWVGGLDSYDTAGSSQNTGRGSGAQRTSKR